MRIGHFTRLKGRTSCFRRKLPARLRDRIARCEICVRLGVLDRESAERQGRRLAVAVDDFFLAALDDAMLSDDDLKKVITSTMATWWDDDERRDAEFPAKWKARSIAPKDDAKLLGEMANGILGRLAKGKNAHQPHYIQSRVEAAGLPPIDDTVDMHMVGEQVSIVLAAYYLSSAVALADRYDLGQERRALPVENWRRHLRKLLGQLGLSDSGSSPGQGGFAWQFPTLTATSDTHQTTSAPASKTSSTAKLFSEVARECLDDRIASGQVKSSVRHHSAASIRIWLEVIGDNRSIGSTGRICTHSGRS